MNYILLAAVLLLQGVIHVRGQSPADSLRDSHQNRKVAVIETGVASYYHSKFHGRPTASGQKYDTAKFTAAHNSLPFGTRIKVTNIRNKRSVTVTVNDRLHHRNTRLVDLSKAAAAKLGFLGKGLTRVKVELLK